MMMMRVAFTKLTSSRGLGKSIRRKPGGELEKRATIHMAEGHFQTIEIAWENFGDFLAGMSPGEALSYGVCCKKDGRGNFFSEGRITTKALEYLLEEAGEAGCARTKNNFKFHEPPCQRNNILFIDIDGIKSGDVGGEGNGEGEGAASVEGTIEKLIELFPALTQFEGGCWAFASAGANIYDTETGEEIKGLSGVHAYFCIPNQIRIEEIKEYLMLQSWRNGSGRFELNEHRYGVSVLERGFIDFAVFQAERLDFIGGTLCEPGSGLVQKREAPVWFDTYAGAGAGAGASANGFLTQAQAEEAEKCRVEARNAARKRAGGRNKAVREALRQEGGATGELSDKALARAGEEGRLGGMFPILFDGLGEVPVWKLIFFPEKYAGRYCADPLYPEKGTQKATFYYNEGSDRETAFIIGSFAKGGRNYVLDTDIDGVRAMLKNTDQDEVKKRMLTDPRWVQELTELNFSVDMPEVLKIIKEKKIADKAEMQSKLGAEFTPKLGRKKVEALKEMNERFAYVTIEGRARYVEDTGRGRGVGAGTRSPAENGTLTGAGELIIRNRNDFLAEVEDLPKIEAWNGGKLVYKNAGTEWLEWEGRRKYPGGIRFEPGINEREFEDPETGLLVLNRFRGFSCAPASPEGYGCGKSACAGKGCVRWFFEEVAAGREGLCPWGTNPNPNPNSNPNLNVSASASASTSASGNGIKSAAGSAAGGNWTYWLKTIHDVACAGVVEHTRWVVDWFADIIQAPGGRGSAQKRSEVSLCLRGGQGTGKDSIFEPIMKILNPYTFTITDMSRITGNFNSFMEDTLFLFANEAIWGGSRKEGNKLKDIITGDTLTIERKGIDSYKARNFIRMGVASNSEWVIPAEEDERRYTIFDVTDAHVKDRSWFAKVKSGLVSELFRELLDWQITNDVCLNLETDALWEQKSLGMSQDIISDFIRESVSEQWFWDEQGLGRAVAHTELEEIFEKRYARRSFDTPEMFKRKLRKKLKEKGGQLQTKIRIKSGSGTMPINGFVMPSMEWFFENFPKLLREQSEEFFREREK